MKDKPFCPLLQSPCIEACAWRVKTGSSSDIKHVACALAVIAASCTGSMDFYPSNELNNEDA